jgi:hypothetical protein
VVPRFSKSVFDDDGRPDVRGPALKLGGVEGTVLEGAPPGQRDFAPMNEAMGRAA